MRWISNIAILALAVSLLSGCDVSRLTFVTDRRVHIVEPEDGSHVRFPVSLTWDVKSFAVTGRDGGSESNAGYFAVFVDRPPIPPGRTLEWYARQDGSCGGGACGKVSNLAHIHTTTDTKLDLTVLPSVRADGHVEQHEVVIVLLNGTGARIGESAFRVQFTVERKA